MCGIYGICLEPGREIPPEHERHISLSLGHRGPDHSGSFRRPGLLLGMDRLAIVDLAGGNQPIFNEDGSKLIIYNGETYNHRELRPELAARGHIFAGQSDTETILHAFEEYGPACLERLGGMFAFAVWDQRAQSLFLARDRLGIKPLYLLELPGGGLAFASEAKALLPLIPGGPLPDWTALDRYLSFGYLAGGDSPFQGIRKLPAGHSAWWREGRLEFTRWWRPELDTLAEPPTYPQAQARLAELLERAVERELMSDVPVGLFLSGGLDSSAVAWLAKRHLSGPVHSFALKFAEPTHDESADARLVARHLGLEHQELAFGPADLRPTLLEVARVLDEPFGDSTVVPLYALSAFARRSLKVVLTGWGGDEAFAGYPTYRAHQLAALYRRWLPGLVRRGLVPWAVGMLPVSDRYFSLEFKAKRFLRGQDLPPGLQHLAWMGYYDEAGKQRLLAPAAREQIRGQAMDPVAAALNEMGEKEIVATAQHLDQVFFLEGNGLFQADRMTMAHSLEARVPLLNPELLAYVNALPTRLKMPRGRTKELLRSVLAPHLPERILNKPKKGFGPPSAAWTRGALAGLLADLFARPRVEAQGLFNYDEVERLRREHLERKADHGRNLWALLSLQLWYERFILGDDLGRWA